MQPRPFNTQTVYLKWFAITIGAIGLLYNVYHASHHIHKKLFFEATTDEGLALPDFELSSTGSTSEHFALPSETFTPEQEKKLRQLAYSPMKWEDVPDKFKLEHQPPGRRYFVYQPSGGWGNQRMIIRYAMVCANAMNRTLILAPTGPHTSMYYNFNRLPVTKLVSLGQVLDLEILSTGLRQGVVVHNDTLASLQEHYLKDLTWKRYEKVRYEQGTKKPVVWSFNHIKHKFNLRAYRKYDVIFWHRSSMWGCCSNSHRYDHQISFNNHFKSLARVLMEPYAPYNAIHVRRGDHRVEGGITRADRRSPENYVKMHMQEFDKSRPLYIATDESRREWFDPMKDHGFKKILFIEDLNKELVERVLSSFPDAIRMDMTAFIEILICGYAERWTGSNGSTFTIAIHILRQNLELRQITGI